MKKYLFYLISFAFILTLAACNNADASESLTTDDVVSAFKDAGLEAEEPREMTKDDYGIGPMKAEEGTRFLIPSLGDDSGGRILTYDKESDLDEMKEYYDSMGEESAILFSWTIKHENVLVQINGSLEEAEYEKYKEALEGL
ncbi:stress protein [Oceanobacillus kimchii]|uniref:stress protein n=1 Tax=Oceanobacillus kimchii TaxID=746691 RepID=UPI0023301FC5|nr:stress protein [Oceanobacillus kimchii]